MSRVFGSDGYCIDVCRLGDGVTIRVEIILENLVSSLIIEDRMLACDRVRRETLHASRMVKQIWQEGGALT